MAFLSILFVPAVAQQAGPSIGGIKYSQEDSLIQAFVLITGKDSIRFSLVCGADEGIKNMQLTSSDVIISKKECFGGKSCRVSGNFPASGLKSDVVTVEALSTSLREQKEKIRINPSQGGEKVYTITALPEFSGTSDLFAAGTDTQNYSPSTAATDVASNSATPTGPAITQLPPQDELPLITSNVSKKNKNDYTLFLLVTDKSGVDFIELLDDGKFTDVEICSNNKSCQMVRNVKITEKGTKVYTDKTMSTSGKFAFQDIKLNYED